MLKRTCFTSTSTTVQILTPDALLRAFREWAAAVLDVHDLEAQLNSKCGGRLLAQGKVLRGIVFREWLQVVHKKKKALKRWKHQALVQMFTDWAGLCAGTQFASFTRAKVQMLTQQLQSAGSCMRACRTSVRALPRV